jgi:hypothetical protein
LLTFCRTTRIERDGWTHITTHRVLLSALPTAMRLYSLCAAFCQPGIGSVMRLGWLPTCLTLLLLILWFCLRGSHFPLWLTLPSRTFTHRFTTSVRQNCWTPRLPVRVMYTWLVSLLYAHATLLCGSPLVYSAACYAFVGYVHSVWFQNIIWLLLMARVPHSLYGSYALLRFCYASLCPTLNRFLPYTWTSRGFPVYHHLHFLPPSAVHATGLPRGRLVLRKKCSTNSLRAAYQFSVCAGTVSCYYFRRRGRRCKRLVREQWTWCGLRR